MFLIHNSPEEAPMLASALVALARTEAGWYSPAQPELLKTLFANLLEIDIDFSSHPPISQEEVQRKLVDPLQRKELIELMVALEMLCSPIPTELELKVESWAKSLDIHSDLLILSRELATNAIDNATADFYRLNWIGETEDQESSEFKKKLAKYGTSAYGLCMEEDPVELKRWSSLSSCRDESLGKALYDFYQERGFKLPGTIGSGNASLAHHDWIHVIAGYDTTPIGELEVTAFMATSSHSKGVMLGFIGAISILETGLLHSLFGADKFAKTLSKGDGISRVVNAIQRGRSAKVDPLLGVDYFAIADQPLDQIRESWGLQN